MRWAGTGLPVGMCRMEENNVYPTGLIFNMTGT
jgi:hypothetical protein